jgi:hypothetical protein
VCEPPGLSDDPEVAAAVKAFLDAHGGELMVARSSD